MSGYDQKPLEILQHIPKVSPQYSPHAYIPIQYTTAKKQEHATAPDTSPSLDQNETKYIQSFTGSLLYYGRALDHTILPVLNGIASEQ